MIWYFFSRNFSFDDAHCEGARVIAQAAREAGVKRLIHVSALNASEESPSKFLQSKVIKEEFISFLLFKFNFIWIVIETSPYGCQNELLNQIRFQSFHTDFLAFTDNHSVLCLWLVDFARLLTTPELRTCRDTNDPDFYRAYDQLRIEEVHGRITSVTSDRLQNSP